MKNKFLKLANGLVARTQGERGQEIIQMLIVLVVVVVALLPDLQGMTHTLQGGMQNLNGSLSQNLGGAQ